MIARFNYTGRERLRHDSIRVVVRGGPPRAFDAEWDFSGKVFPAEARVYFEATSSGSPTVRRYGFGTIGAPAAPADRSLDGITGDRVVFTVKVVDEGEEVGKILGLAEGLRPTVADEPDDAGRRPLLPVNLRDLGERVWRVEFRDEGPWLEANSAIPGIRHVVRADGRFAATVFPEVVRQVLERVLLVRGKTSIENDDADVWDQWLRMAAGWADGAPPPEVDAAEVSNRQELEDWIEDAVDGFCRRKGFRDLFTEALDDEAAGVDGEVP